MNQLTCGCEYVDSLILSFCPGHKHPGPESHKDGKGIIIRDLEAQLEERDKAMAPDDHHKCVEGLIEQRDKAYREVDATKLQNERLQNALREIEVWAEKHGGVWACSAARLALNDFVEKPVSEHEHAWYADPARGPGSFCRNCPAVWLPGVSDKRKGEAPGGCPICSEVGYCIHKDQ